MFYLIFKPNVFQATIAGYIRLFEPLVIKSLKLYTSTSDVELQKQVLNLLIQLIHLRVNYCLLDSDQVKVLTRFRQHVSQTSCTPM